MESLLLVGAVIGMRHALEADHVAAVAALATGGRRCADIVAQGTLWGLGHAFALLAFAGLVLIAGARVPAHYAEALELAVGVMLVLLGLDVVRRFVRAGSGLGTTPSRSVSESRRRGAIVFDGTMARALLVGVMHGMAGSAALIVLSLQSVDTVAQGLAYIAAFGVGSVLGMAAVSALLASSLKAARGMPGWMVDACTGGIGIGTAALGTFIVYQIGIVGGLLA